MSRINGFFSDYDGTLAPSNVQRNDSAIPSDIERLARQIASQVPFAIITSKDFDFIFPRTRFAIGWACVCGLDIRLADGRTIVAKGLPNMEKILHQINRSLEKGMIIEAKRGASGELLGLSIDWRNSNEPPLKVGRYISELSQKGMHVVQDRNYPFIDIFGSHPDKGRALKELKRLLNIDSGITFLGDSVLDNPAFHEADISVGILHGQPLNELECEFVVNYDELPEFLASLKERGMDFSPELPNVRRRVIG
jgi:trehalose-6-phosphatase